eukprot:3613594-Pleurochrysis_carterae.AAC.1
MACTKQQKRRRRLTKIMICNLVFIRIPYMFRFHLTLRQTGRPQRRAVSMLSVGCRCVWCTAYTSTGVYYLRICCPRSPHPWLLARVTYASKAR